jgi:hypothetical protein
MLGQFGSELGLGLSLVTKSSHCYTAVATPVFEISSQTVVCRRYFTSIQPSDYLLFSVIYHSLGLSGRCSFVLISSLKSMINYRVRCFRLFCTADVAGMGQGVFHVEGIVMKF